MYFTLIQILLKYIFNLVGKQVLCPKKMSQKDYIVINNIESHDESENITENEITDPLLLSKKLHQLILK